MKIGVPIEIKRHEYRVGLTPFHAASYVHHGHTVYVQTGAGIGSGYTDLDYIAVGCKILPTIEDVYAAADMIIKIKEPLEPEYNLMRENQIVYTYFHLAADKDLTDTVIKRKVTAVAYETITDDFGGLPCLKPMSEIAGRLSTIEGAKYLEKPFGGRGVLMGGVPGVLPANVVVLGGAGIAGRNAVAMAVGLHADVTVLDINIPAMTEMDNMYKGRIKTVYNTPAALEQLLENADLVIGATLTAGARAVQLVKRDMVKRMKKGAVIVDIAIDQGGNCETSKLTYHDNPVYQEEGVNHYCVGNMPGAVPRTSTMALNNSTLHYGLKLAADCVGALKTHKHLANGLNAYKGAITCKPVADFFNMPYVNPTELL